MSDKQLLVEKLQSNGILKSDEIKNALMDVDRSDFMPLGSKQFSYVDNAFPIGYGQTISQPLTVVFMLELLETQKGNYVLDVGSGSGWQTGLLSFIVDETGHVDAYEIVKPLCDFGKENLSRYPFLVDRVTFYSENAKNLDNITYKYDRIIVSAEVNQIPNIWRDRLNIDGIMVYPKSGGIIKEIKTSEDNFVMEVYPGFRFVPFIE